MVIRITEQAFWEALKGAKRPAEVLLQNTERTQLIVGWWVQRAGAKTHLMVKIYTSIFGAPGQGISRGVGQDSIRVALVDTKTDKGVGKTAYTQRTPGWEGRLIDKVRELFALAEKTLDAGQPPRCPCCGGTMGMRTAARGSNAGSQFWGCNNFPRCRGSLPLVTLPVEQPTAGFHQLAKQRRAASRWT